MTYLAQIVSDLDPILDRVQPLAMAWIFLAFISRFIKW